jgi:hypothetical protein
MFFFRIVLSKLFNSLFGGPTAVQGHTFASRVPKCKVFLFAVFQVVTKMVFDGHRRAGDKMTPKRHLKDSYDKSPLLPAAGEDFRRK